MIDVMRMVGKNRKNSGRCVCGISHISEVPGSDMSLEMIS
jgi:hypothetical protein